MQHRCCIEGIPFAGLVHGCSEGVLISAGGSEGSLKEKGPMKSILNSPTAGAGHLQTLEPSYGMKSTYLRHLIHTEQSRELPTQHLDTRLGKAVGISPASQQVPLRTVAYQGYLGDFPERGQQEKIRSDST